MVGLAVTPQMQSSSSKRFFFFQAEDGIRDKPVTGVQTCALPICLCRLLSAPTANRTFSTLFCESFLRCLSPYPGGPAECICLVLPQRHRPSPKWRNWVGFRYCPANATFRGAAFRGCS